MSAQLLGNDRVKLPHSAPGSSVVAFPRRVERRFCGKRWRHHFTHLLSFSIAFSKAEEPVAPLNLLLVKWDKLISRISRSSPFCRQRSTRSNVLKHTHKLHRRICRAYLCIRDAHSSCSRTRAAYARFIVGVQGKLACATTLRLAAKATGIRAAR